MKFLILLKFLCFRIDQLSKMPRGRPKKPDKKTAQSSTEEDKEDTSLQGQKPRGQPKKTENVNAESPTKGGKMNTSLQEDNQRKLTK